MWQSACPAAFMLKKFTSMQHTYFAYELEALGVLEALMKWLDELMGGHTFTVVTDHKALTYFKEKTILLVTISDGKISSMVLIAKLFTLKGIKIKWLMLSATITAPHQIKICITMISSQKI